MWNISLSCIFWETKSAFEALKVVWFVFYHRITTSLVYLDRQRRRYIITGDCDYSCVKYGVSLQSGKLQVPGNRSEWHQGGWYGKGACKAHPHFTSRLMLLHSLITEQQGLMGERQGGGMWFEGIKKRNWQRRIHCGPSMELLFLSPGTELEVPAAANNL